jgi:hypothetical protein
VTVYGLISDRDLSLANSRFLRRLKYWLGKLGSTCEYFLINEWSDGHRHNHIVLRVTVPLTKKTIRALWEKTLACPNFTCHCAPVRNPGGLARYVVKDLKDRAKKELPPRSFQGRLFSYSRHFFTKSVAALWEEQVREWYPQPQAVLPRKDTMNRELTPPAIVREAESLDQIASEIKAEQDSGDRHMCQGIKELLYANSRYLIQGIDIDTLN